MPTSDWPRLSAADRPTIVALNFFAQIVGKVPTALLPWRNHGWHLTLHPGPRGLATEPLHHPAGTFTLILDLVDHELLLEDRHGRCGFVLGPTTVAEFHAQLLALLDGCGYPVAIDRAPNEVDPAIPFADDHAPRAYDEDAATRLLRALLSADRVLRRFRSSFLGKSSPVHFFWGSFDLAVTRFSGRAAPLHPGGVPNLPDAVTREAYSHEVSSAGFWPGGAGAEGGPLFYSYAYPVPDGLKSAKVKPKEARFDGDLGEFVLDYDAVRGAGDPDAALTAFLESTYAAAADLAQWDRAALDCAIGQPGIPRAV